MEGFNEKEGQLYVDDLPISDIAHKFGTPAFIYSGSAIKNNYNRYANALRKGDQTAMQLKPTLISIYWKNRRPGSGFDVVSGNELKRCIEAGADPRKIVFSGVAKSTEDIELAINLGILSINIESEDEFDRIAKISKAIKKAVQCSIRINPDIPTGSHKYIETGLKTSKFGVDNETLLNISLKAKDTPLIKISGIACHIGSQISDNSLIIKSLEFLLDARQLLMKNGHEINS